MDAPVCGENGHDVSIVRILAIAPGKRQYVDVFGGSG